MEKFIKSSQKLTYMRAHTVAGVGLAALLVGVSGCADEFAEERQEAINRLSKRGISTEIIKNYEKLGLDVDDVGQLVNAKVTPEIVKQLKEKEGLDPREISFLVITGHLDKKIKFEPSRFDGEEYQRWSAHGIPLVVMGASKSEGVTLEQALAWNKAGFAPKNLNPYDMDGYVRLAAHRVKFEDAVKLKQEGLDVDVIVKKYADAVGTTPQNRVAYLKMGYEDPQIKVLTAKGIVPDIARTLTSVPQLRYGERSLDELEKPLDKQEFFKLAATGKITGDIYNKFTAEGFKPREAVYVIRNGKDLQKAIDWHAVGYGIDEMIECEKVGINLFMMLEIGKKLGIKPYEAVLAVKSQKVLTMYPSLAKP